MKRQHIDINVRLELGKIRLTLPKSMGVCGGKIGPSPGQILFRTLLTFHMYLR